MTQSPWCDIRHRVYLLGYHREHFYFTIVGEKGPKKRVGDYHKTEIAFDSLVKGGDGYKNWRSYLLISLRVLIRVAISDEDVM